MTQSSGWPTTAKIGAAHRPALVLQLDDVADDLAVLAALHDGRSRALSFSAVAGLTSTALSHVSFVIGFGSSCSQPLLANRPSSTEGSRRNEISRPVRGRCGCGGAELTADSVDA